jgi:uncharacterized protein YydD (DUF2326 family)
MNIVAGLQSSSLSTDTYNGIGKSSSLQLVHLMLGGKLEPKKYPSDRMLLNFLSGYGEFSLDLEVGTVPYTIRVNFNDGVYYLNNEKVGKYATLGKKLTEKCLNTLGELISFKQVLNCFARRYLPGRNYYTDALQQQGRSAEDFYQRVANLVLLGLDASLAHQFKAIRDELEKIEKAKTTLKNANLTENESELRDLEDKLEKLVSDKNSFVIAKNYDALQLEADHLTEQMNNLRNKIFSNGRDIRNKQELLDTSKEVQSVDLSRVERIFEEANFHFSDLVQKRLEEAEEFHVRVHSARRKRIEQQVSQLKHSNDELNGKLLSLELIRDNILKDLDSKGALEEYNSIVEHIRTIEGKIAELSSYQTTVATVEREQAEWESQKASIKLQAVEYIECKKDLIKDIEKKFRSLVLRFYTDHGGALRIQKNPGEAKYLFDIEPYIQKDASQGVGEVKIFCYDMLLFELNPKLLGFIAHDSFLFGGVDLRQSKMMFKIALEMCKNKDLQYFVNLNKDLYERLISTETEDDVLTTQEKEAIIHGTVLELFDDKPENTLFGQYFG